VVAGIVVHAYGEMPSTYCWREEKAERTPILIARWGANYSDLRSQRIIKRAIETLREKLIEESIVVALVCIWFSSGMCDLHLSRYHAAAAIYFYRLFRYFLLGQNLQHHVLGGIAIAIGANDRCGHYHGRKRSQALEHFREKHNRDPDPG